MTPAQHATAASDLLAAPAATGDSLTLERNAQAAQVHARLAKTTGAGADYTSAEAALTAYKNASTGGLNADHHRALAYAHLAPTA